MGIEKIEWEHPTTAKWISQMQSPYDKAIGLDLTFAVPLANKAILLRALGRTAEAEEAERKAAELSRP